MVAFARLKQDFSFARRLMLLLRVACLFSIGHLTRGDRCHSSAVTVVCLHITNFDMILEEYVQSMKCLLFYVFGPIDVLLDFFKASPYFIFRIFVKIMGYAGLAASRVFIT